MRYFNLMTEVIVMTKGFELSCTLVAIRKFNNISPLETAKLLGISVDFLRKVEYNEIDLQSYPTRDDLLRQYSEKFDIPLEGLHIIRDNPNHWIVKTLLAILEFIIKKRRCINEKHSSER